MEIASLLEKAIAIAVEAHRGQKDRYGAPYILNPLRVMARVDRDIEKTVAVLHDAVDDTNWKFAGLKREGFPEEVLQALDCLTKREGEEYEGFVNRSAGNPLARRVKIGDLEDNMDVRRFKSITTDDQKRLQKYLTAWRKLTGS